MTARARDTWRWARRLLFGLLALQVLLALLLVALRTSFAREQIRTRVNAALSQQFQGRLQLERLGQLSLGGVGSIDARVFDAQGRQVLDARGLSVVASLPGLGWQLLMHANEPELVLDSVRVRHVDVTLRDDEELGVSLARAFLPRETEAPAPASESGGTRLRIERAVLDHVWAHGQLGSSLALDAELYRVLGALEQSPRRGFELNLQRATLVARNLPGDPRPRGAVGGKLEVPADPAGALLLEGHFDGNAAGSPAKVDVRWLGDDLQGHVSVLQLPAAFVNQRVPQLRLDGSVALEADVQGALPVLSFDASVDATAAHVDARGYAVVAQGLELAVSVDVTRLDAAGLVPSAPATDLQLRLEAFAFEADDDLYVFSERAELPGGRIGSMTTPPGWLSGEGRWDATAELSAQGRLGFDDPGLALRGHYRLALPRDGSGSVSGALQAELNDPPRLQQLLGLRAAGQAEAKGELRLAEGALSVQASLNLRHLDQAVVQARNVALAARATGTLDQPRVQAAVTLDVLSGRAHADWDYSSKRQELELFVSDVDLLRLSRILGKKLPLEQATLGATARLSQPTASAAYVLDANAKLDFGKLGAAQLTASQLQLPTELSSVARLGDLKGQLAVTGKLKLEELSPLLAQTDLPLERTTGSVRFELSASHAADDPQGLELAAALDTVGLRIIQQRQAPKAVVTRADALASQPLALEGIDLRLSVHARPKLGDAFGTLLLRDPHGTLAELQARTQLPEAWLTAGAQAWQHSPLKARLVVPERRLASLPSVLRPEALRGRVSLEANLEGSLAAPQLDAQVAGQALRAAGSKEPLDVDAQLRYAPDQGQCRVEARRAQQPGPVAKVSCAWRGDLRHATELASGHAGLVASADVELAEFPLDLLPFVVDRQVSGRVTGKATLKDWGQDAKLDAAFRSSTLNVGKVAIQNFTVSAKNGADQLSAQLELKVGSGAARAELGSSLRWGRRPLPELSRSGTAKLEARAFDLSTLSPLLAAYVSELGGVLDARTQLDVTPTTTHLSGSAKLQKGVLQVPSIGQRFSDISARVAVDGKRLRVEDLTARGTTGKVTGKASANLEGFELRGAEAHLSIAKNESLPLTLEGATLGDVWGNVDATYQSPLEGERKLDIQVPTLHLVTPETSGPDLQSLDTPPEIRVGVRRADGTFTALPLQPLAAGGESDDAAGAASPLRIRVRLGQDVTVERGRTAEIQLTGQLDVTSAAKTDVSGRIEVRGGKLDVSGKTFQIERGVVTFEGDDPGNPTITATARWDAPEYTVYADYVGDVKNGRIKLRSEPPLTPTEIANLLLFGSAEGSAAGSGTPDTAALAVGVAGDTAAQGLNQVLDDFTKLDVSARIDTTTGSARPELVFQVSKRVSARVSRAIGAPAAGEPLDRTFLTLEMRLQRAWALSAVFGDHGGSALDLIWRRRY